MIDDGLRTRPVNMARCREDDAGRAVDREETVDLTMPHHKSEAEAVRKRTIWESYAGMHHLYGS
jgi:hypothetical protein